MNAVRLLLGALLVASIASCGKSGKSPTRTVNAAEDPPVLEDGSVALPVAYSDLGWADDVFSYKDEPFNGVAIEKYKNGQMSKQYEFEGGKFHGVTREWYENGGKKSETYFDKGRRHGPNTYWDEDGKVIKRQKYDQDVVVESTDPTEVEK